jgi:ethanolamine phosphate phosphodiesterase
MPALSRRPALASLRTDLSLLTWLRIFWFLGVLWCELVIYRYTLFFCGWPDHRLTSVRLPTFFYGSSLTLCSQSSATPTHLLVIADPQVRHAGAQKYTRFFPQLHDWFYHAGLRKSWRYASHLRPDIVVFLGDMMASGRKIRDDDECVQMHDVSPISLTASLGMWRIT